MKTKSLKKFPEKISNEIKIGFDILISVQEQKNIQLAAEKRSISPSEFITLAVKQKVKATLPKPIPENTGRKLEYFNIIFSEEDEKNIKKAAKLKNQSISDFINSAISWEKNLIRDHSYDNIIKDLNIHKDDAIVIKQGEANF